MEALVNILFTKKIRPTRFPGVERTVGRILWSLARLRLSRIIGYVLQTGVRIGDRHFVRVRAHSSHVVLFKF